MDGMVKNQLLKIYDSGSQDGVIKRNLITAPGHDTRNPYFLKPDATHVPFMANMERASISYRNYANMFKSFTEYPNEFQDSCGEIMWIASLGEIWSRQSTTAAWTKGCTSVFGEGLYVQTDNNFCAPGGVIGSGKDIYPTPIPLSDSDGKPTPYTESLQRINNEYAAVAIDRMLHFNKFYTEFEKQLVTIKQYVDYLGVGRLHTDDINYLGNFLEGGDEFYTLGRRPTNAWLTSPVIQYASPVDAPGSKPREVFLTSILEASFISTLVLEHSVTAAYVYVLMKKNTPKTGKIKNVT